MSMLSLRYEAMEMIENGHGWFCDLISKFFLFTPNSRLGGSAGQFVEVVRVRNHIRQSITCQCDPVASVANIKLLNRAARIVSLRLSTKLLNMKSEPSLNS